MLVPSVKDASPASSTGTDGHVLVAILQRDRISATTLRKTDALKYIFHNILIRSQGLINDLSRLEIMPNQGTNCAPWSS